METRFPLFIVKLEELTMNLVSKAAKNHKHSKNNPYSQFRNGWTVEQVLEAPKITNELTKFMCSPTSDGGILFKFHSSIRQSELIDPFP
jgi:hypothetical protein